MDPISPEQLSRIAKRAHDVQRRTYSSGTEASARPVDFGQLAADLKRHGAPGAQGLLGAFGRLGGMLGAIGGTAAMGPDGPVRFGGEAPSPDLAPPPSDAQMADGQRRIGRALPEELRQLYSVGDGGFGPGGGLFPLAMLVERYLDLTREPFGPAGQDWPANLVPLFDDNPVLLCLDLDTGAIIAWDPEEIEDEESEADWQRSFKPQAASLSQLLDDWLAAPTQQEETARMLREARERMAARRPSPVTGWPMQIDDPAQQAEGEIAFLRQAPALRQSYGLPETGWEDEVRRRHGAL